MNKEILAKWILELGEAEIESHKESKSAKSLMDNVDFIGEEENFSVIRTIDLEQRHFHGKLKTTAYQEGMETMLRHIVYKIHTYEEA